MRHAHLLGCREPLMYRLVPALVGAMGQAFGELGRAEALITETFKLEEERFKQTLDRGLRLLEEETGRLGEGQTLSGEVAFRLYDTFGFPLDLTEDILREVFKSSETVLEPAEVPPYLVPGSLPVWSSDYPQTFRDQLDQLPPLAGYTFHPGDAEHAGVGRLRVPGEHPDRGRRRARTAAVALPSGERHLPRLPGEHLLRPRIGTGTQRHREAHLPLRRRVVSPTRS